jgi:hypothetical protein
MGTRSVHLRFGTPSLPANRRRRRELLTTGARTTSELRTLLTFAVAATGMTMHPNATVRRILLQYGLGHLIDNLRGDRRGTLNHPTLDPARKINRFWSRQR